MSAEIAVQVVWSTSERKLSCVVLTLPHDADVSAALAAAPWPELARAAEGDAAFAAAGLSAAVWGRARALTHRLRDGDRVEVLRDLQIDPMNARRVRFEAAGGIDVLRRRGYAGRKQR